MKHTLLFNGKIYSLDRNTPSDWIYIAGNTILAAGAKDTPPPLNSDTVEKIDLEGNTVLPAFADAHLHIIPTAMKLEQLDLEPCKSPEAVITLLKIKNPEAKGGWILGAGYNRNLWDKTQPDKKMLDKLYPDTPVALASKDLHALWINSEALKISRIDSNTPDPENGRIERYINGEPTGLLYESACENVFRQFNEVTKVQLQSLLKTFSKYFFSLGITFVNAIEEIQTWNDLQQLRREDKLPLRVLCHLPHKHIETLARAGIRSGLGDEWLRLGGIKIFTDGSLGSQTADLFESYLSKPGYFGISTITEELLTERLVLAAKSGLSGIVHAIGNRAVHKTLNGFSKALQWQREFNLIQRIEHAQLINPDDLPRLKEYGLTASMQPSHIADDVEVANRHWGDLSRNAYPMRQLRDIGVNIALGSDSPVADPNPLRNIYTAVERKYLSDPKNVKWYPQNAISLMEAVRAHTIGVAEASYAAHYLGTLTPGKRADMIVLDHNIFELPVESLLETKVLKTFIDGNLVYTL